MASFGKISWVMLYLHRLFWNPLFSVVGGVLISRMRRCNAAFFQGVAVVPTNWLATFHEATGAQVKPLCARSTYWRCCKMWFIATWGADWARITPDVQKPTVSGTLQLQDWNFTNTNYLHTMPHLTCKCECLHTHTCNCIREREGISVNKLLKKKTK